MGEQPRRPDQEYDPPFSALAAGGRAGTFRGFLVVIFGSGQNKGLFVYSGTPAKGNLVESITASNGTDPYGNKYYAGTATYASSGGNSLVVNLLSTGSGTIGFFQYANPSGGVQGALILSVVSAAGTDPVTSTSYPAGLQGTDPVFADSTLVVGSGIAFNGGSFTRAAGSNIGLPADSAHQPVWFANGPEQTTASHGQLLLAGASPDGSTKPAQVLISAEAGGAAGVTATNAMLEVQGGTGQVVARLIANAAATLALAARVTADTNDRLTSSAAGVVSWGSGAASTDTSLQRSAAGVLQLLSTMVTTVAGVAETWHSLGTLAGYTVTVGLYRLDVLGNLELDIVVVAGGANATLVTFSVTLPAAYRPANQKEIPMATTANQNTGSTWPRVIVTTAGAVQVNTVVNNTATWYACGSVPLN